ncbi:MAG: hypothetical protein R2713_16685 [Ilumatobacteraceae bacterium]
MRLPGRTATSSSPAPSRSSSCTTPIPAPSTSPTSWPSTSTPWCGGPRLDRYPELRDAYFGNYCVSCCSPSRSIRR